ncbi:type II secretion system F family protein [uncultured Friedmanniella sp.]|uniref:type II secretion system F family protein n=1 Tax=uncultured Friedmanniella sp. TaxID=335381 RepID=UPI0035CCA900
MNGRVLLAAGLAALAVLLAVRDPAARLRLLVRPRRPPRGSPAVVRLMAGRPGAPSLGRRFWLSLAAGGASCWALSDSVPHLGSWVWVGWPLVTAGGVLALGWLEPLAARRRQQRLVLEVPQALELMAACLAVGTPPRAACGALIGAFDGPVAEDLQPVLLAVELGSTDTEAWTALAGHPQLGPAAVDLARSVESGTQMVEALRTHARVAREHRRSALQQVARGVGVRSVLPLMLCFVPAFLLLGVVPTVVSAVVQAFP